MNRLLLVLCLYVVHCVWTLNAAAQCDSEYLEVNDTLYVTGHSDDSLETFKVNAKGIKEIKLLVYSRKGKKVFESTSSILEATEEHYRVLDTGWDGTQMGKALLAGLYVYMIEAQCTDQKTVYKSGTVQLVYVAPKAAPIKRSP